MKKFDVWVIVLLRLYYFVTGDDTAITTSTENVFNKWCNWVGSVICMDKCSTFGTEKNGN